MKKEHCLTLFAIVIKNEIFGISLFFGIYDRFEIEEFILDFNKV